MSAFEFADESAGYNTLLRLMTLGVRFQISHDPKSQNPEPETWNLYTYLVAAEGLIGIGDAGKEIRNLSDYFIAYHSSGKRERRLYCPSSVRPELWFDKPVLSTVPSFDHSTSSWSG